MHTQSHNKDRLEYWEVDLLSQVQHSLQRAVESARQGVEHFNSGSPMVLLRLFTMHVQLSLRLFPNFT